jgi:predicted nucleic acid-binding protein
MKYVLDASEIIDLVLRLGSKAIDIFKECLMMDLDYYEIGNFLLKIKRIDLAKDFINVMIFLI